ncbi:purine and uridine phosphorylase [Aspergillus avenaceus]|uniref:Purine and uridine phosphorylase n=1 Tax=Aspergillus avenaceus TaxID=36643 RepID=A0A5N6U3U7_ASPAV|nr:purine and uridine phosphorylase [Aspergillus avenaceus]
MVEERKKLSHKAYTVTWICALPAEQTAALAMLDERHYSLPTPLHDDNAYILGHIDRHNIAITCLPSIGTNSACSVLTSTVHTFPSIRYALMIGIGGGIPSKVRLGDVVIGWPVDEYEGVVEWDRSVLKGGERFRCVGSLERVSGGLEDAVDELARGEKLGERIRACLDATERRYPRLMPRYTRCEGLVDTGGVWRGWSVMAWIVFWVIYLLLNPFTTIGKRGSVYVQEMQSERREVRVHYGLIASGNRVVKDAKSRDALDEMFGGQLLCVEMEAAGLMNVFPCLVIRGICDYADARKNKSWQGYAAMVAAAYARELLGSLPVSSEDDMEIDVG